MSKKKTEWVPAVREGQKGGRRFKQRLDKSIKFYPITNPVTTENSYRYQFNIAWALSHTKAVPSKTSSPNDTKIKAIDRMYRVTSGQSTGQLSGLNEDYISNLQVALVQLV